MTSDELDHTAAELAVANVPRESAEATAAAALARLAGSNYANATDVAVLRDERLVGLVGIEQLLAAAAETPLEQLARAAAVVAPSDGVDMVAREAVRSRARSVAVVDAETRLVGIIPPERLLALLELEHEEDMARLGGFCRARALL